MIPVAREFSRRRLAASASSFSSPSSTAGGGWSNCATRCGRTRLSSRPISASRSAQLPQLREAAAQAAVPPCGVARRGVALRCFHAVVREWSGPESRLYSASFHTAHDTTWTRIAGGTLRFAPEPGRGAPRICS
eukprot:scaffold1492_cov257-Pinguiococcus_pyrenoidosus.AAC.12